MKHVFAWKLFHPGRVGHWDHTVNSGPPSPHASLHLCLLMVQKNWESWILHFYFPNLMCLLLVDVPQSHKQKHSGIQFPIIPKLPTQLSRTIWTLALLFMLWGPSSQLNACCPISHQDQGQWAEDKLWTQSDETVHILDLSTISNCWEEHTCGSQ